MVAVLRSGVSGRLLRRSLLAALVLCLAAVPGATAKPRAKPARADLTLRSTAAKLDAGTVRVSLVAANAGRRRAPASTGMVRWKPAGGRVVTVLRRFRLPALKAGARRPLAITLPVPSGASGAFTVSVCLDVRTEVRERVRGNNCRAAGRVTVPAAAALGEVRTSPGVTTAPPAGGGAGPGTPAPPTPPSDTAPETSIGRGPAGTTNVRTATFLFSASDAAATFECRLDGGTWATCAGAAVFSALPDGVHTFDVRATGAGGTDATPATRSWTVDGTAPETSITAGPAAVVGATSASLEFSSSEPGSSFECRVDNGGWTFCVSPAQPAGLAAGAHTFQVRATDAAGNRDATPASRAWTVDIAGPPTTLGASPAVTGPAAAFTFSSQEAGATFECRLDGGSWAACASPAAYAGLTDGSHTFDVRAVDAVGNSDLTPATATWTVDATAPETTIDGAPSGTVAEPTADIAFSSPEQGVTFECRLDGGAWAPCTSPAGLTGLTDGAHTFDVRAVDALGNADATPATAGWTVALAP